MFYCLFVVQAVFLRQQLTGIQILLLVFLVNITSWLQIRALKFFSLQFVFRKPMDVAIFRLVALHRTHFLSLHYIWFFIELESSGVPLLQTSETEQVVASLTLFGLYHNF